MTTPLFFFSFFAASSPLLCFFQGHSRIRHRDSALPNIERERERERERANRNRKPKEKKTRRRKEPSTSLARLPPWSAISLGSCLFLSQSPLRQTHRELFLDASSESIEPLDPRAPIPPGKPPPRPSPTARRGPPASSPSPSRTPEAARAWRLR